MHYRVLDSNNNVQGHRIEVTTNTLLETTFSALISEIYHNTIILAKGHIIFDESIFIY